MSRRTFALVPFNEWEKDIINRFLKLKNEFPFAETGEWWPNIDVVDKTDSYIVKADVPGFKDPAKTLKVKVDKNGVVTISGTRETEEEQKSENYVRVERSKGSFSRSIALPEAVDSEKVTAKYRHGVLEVTVPKLQKSSPNEIKVETE
jgi:HSP20 family protein